MKIIETSIHRPISVFMVTAGVALFGLVAASRLAVDLLPDISYPSLTVRTDLPDAAPADVEQFVTRPVEEGVGVVPGLSRMYSISRPGQSEVVLEFQSGTRMDLASLAVREKLDLVTLPRESKRPAILRFDPSLDPILRYRLAGSGNMKRLRRIAERTIKRDLEGVPGVAAVKVAGGEEEEIQVEVDEGRLASVGMTLADVTQRLSAENVNLAGGSIVEGRAEYLVRATNQFENPDDIAEVILASRPDGLIRVSDVADVFRGAKDREVIARVGDAEAVEIAVFKEGDANTVTVARAVKERAQRVARTDLPSDLKMITVADQSRFIQNAIDNVTSAAFLGGLLAILVLYAFLRDLRTTMILGLSIPVSVLATAIVMYRMGVSLNLMSLGGLALAVGMVVDNGIVVLESIFKRKEAGEEPRQAAVSGTRIVAKAVVASTLTTVAVFLPLVFVEGLAGQLIRDQAITISFALLASLAVALTLIPTVYAMGARLRIRAPEDAPFRAPRGRVDGFFHWIFRYALAVAVFLPRLLLRGIAAFGRRLRPWVERVLVPFDRALDFLNEAYPKVLRRALEHRPRVVGYSTAALAVSLLVAFLLPRNLFPSFTQGEFFFNVRLPEGSALHVTDAALADLAGKLDEDGAIDHVYTSAGQTDLSQFAGGIKEPNRGQIAVRLKDATNRRGEERAANSLRAAMDDMPGVSYEFDRPALLTFRSPIEVEIYTYDLDTLRSASEMIVALLEDINGVEDVESSVRLGDPEVQIAFDRAKLAAMDLDPGEASRLVRNAVQGEAATQFNDPERKIDVRVRASSDERSLVQSLDLLQVGRNAGEPVRLGAVAKIDVERGPSEIRRISQQRAATVSANLQGRDLKSASEEIQARLSQTDLPPGVRVALAGQNRDLVESFGSLRFALLLAVFLVYLVMASQFESLLHPFVVMFSLPLAVVGVAVGLAFTGTGISIMVLIGLVVLAGIVVNNAIVLVDYANQLRAAGRSKIDALVEAGHARLRPILMTTLTTVLGLLPMAFAFGEGSELRAPLAITLIGGLTLATVLTLVVIPVVYASLDRTS